MDGHPRRRGAQGFLEDFFGLQVASISQVDVGLGHRVHIAGRIELAGRIHHGRTGGSGLGRVDALAAAGSEERIGLQAAFEEGAVHLRAGLALAHPVQAEAGQQGQQGGCPGQHHRVVAKLVDQPTGADIGGCRCRSGSGRRSRCRGRSGRRCIRSGCDGTHRRGSRHTGRCRHLDARHRRRGRHCRGCGSRRCGGSRNGGGCRRGELGQLLDVPVEFSGALLGVLRLAGLGDLVLTAGGCAGGARFGQRELVGRGRCALGVLHLGLHLAAGLLACRCNRSGGCCACQPAAEFVEILALGGDGLARLRLVHGLRGGRRRQVEHAAGLDAVHIAADEGLRIGLEHGHQHLFQRHIGRLVGRCNLAGGVAGSNGDLAATAAGGSGCRRCRPGRAGRRCGGCRGGRRGRHRSRCARTWAGGRCCRHGRQGCRCCRAGAQVGRVEQQGVVAHQPAGGPVGFDHQIDKRLVDRTVAHDAQVLAAIAAALQGDFHPDQGLTGFDASRPERLGAGQPDLQAGGFLGGDLGHLDLGADGFTQCGFHLDRPQGQSKGVRRLGQRQGQHRCGSHCMESYLAGQTCAGCRTAIR